MFSLVLRNRLIHIYSCAVKHAISEQLANHQVTDSKVEIILSSLKEKEMLKAFEIFFIL